MGHGSSTPGYRNIFRTGVFCKRFTLREMTDPVVEKKAAENDAADQERNSAQWSRHHACSSTVTLTTSAMDWPNSVYGNPKTGSPAA
jgi:hypothetical protein